MLICMTEGEALEASVALEYSFGRKPKRFSTNQARDVIHAWELGMRLPLASVLVKYYRSYRLRQRSSRVDSSDYNRECITYHGRGDISRFIQGASHLNLVDSLSSLSPACYYLTRAYTYIGVTTYTYTIIPQDFLCKYL